ncbi:hypothetical protein A2U01_0064755 [Trifolium medium]|uniref:Uncharacterized protein n=1 Tax=Trifolium medium TaxID=97028 RepID=A0A392S3T9_9FABA|nr:hypothetical protein [Trifolium medium]
MTEVQCSGTDLEVFGWVFGITTAIVPFSGGSSGGLVVMFAVGVLAFGSVCLFTVVSGIGCWLLVMEEFVAPAVF